VRKAADLVSALRLLVSRFVKKPAEPIRLSHTLAGELRILKDVKSQFVNAKRNVLVYLPPGYEAETARRYPVLYMNDGQNLFDPRTAYVFGNDWRFGETAERLMSKRQIEPLIVVGVYNAGVHRIDEYTPTRDERRGAGGQAALYGRMLMEELKPYVDWAFRTKPDAAHTGLGGSSLGGLVALSLGLQHPEVFGRLAIHSPSVFWDDEAILRQVQVAERSPGQRIWLDIGTKESVDAHLRARRLRSALVGRGWREPRDLKYVEARGARHEERAWAERVAPMLRFLFPARERRRLIGFHAFPTMMAAVRRVSGGKECRVPAQN